MLTPDGRTKLMDLGIAREHRGGEHHATLRRSWARPATSRPNRLGVSPVDHRSDIYSLGCVLYEMLTGRQPFEARRSARRGLQARPRGPGAADVARAFRPARARGGDPPRDGEGAGCEVPERRRTWRPPSTTGPLARGAAHDDHADAPRAGDGTLSPTAHPDTASAEGGSSRDAVVRWFLSCSSSRARPARRPRVRALRGRPTVGARRPTASPGPSVSPSSSPSRRPLRRRPQPGRPGPGSRRRPPGRRGARGERRNHQRQSRTRRSRRGSTRRSTSSRRGHREGDREARAISERKVDELVDHDEIAHSRNRSWTRRSRISPSRCSWRRRPRTTEAYAPTGLLTSVAVTISRSLLEYFGLHVVRTRVGRTVSARSPRRLRLPATRSSGRPRSDRSRAS